MNIRILVYLVVSACFFAACKKDKDNSHIILKGIVLDQETNAPLANTRVLIDFNLFPRWPNMAFIDSTETNGNGQYEITIPYKDGMEQYFVRVKKDGLVQSTRNWNHIAKGIDSVYMERPSYVQLTVKITQPVPDSITLWMYHFNEQQQAEVFGALDPAPVFKQPGTYTFISGPFSSTLYNRARAVLSKPAAFPGTGDQPVAEKQFEPLPYATTHAEIEY